MVVNKFDPIAPYYDFLSRLVFGKKIIESQIYFTKKIQKNDKILILGGGTGHLLRYFPKGSQIDYLEKSEKMIQFAEKRKCGLSIQFLHFDFLKFKSDHRYTVVICPFFLDCFHLENLNHAIKKIKSLLQPYGLLIVTDFEKSQTDKSLSFLMHLFFKIFVNLESKSLKSIHLMVTREGFRVTDEKFFYQKMIFSRIYRNL
ncbi:MAG: class I SAM-dependent methyltransferase [Bacteroidota bacterium]